MKFIMAYSGGKDCTLALDRMIRQGHEPVALYTTITKRGINYNHFIRKEVYQEYEASLGIPVIFCETAELHNQEDIYRRLKEAIEKYDAKAVCTGDIYLRGIALWNRQMARLLGVEWWCPLWNESTDNLVREVLEKGYKLFIKSVKTEYLSEDYLGKELSFELISEFREKGIDICGEKGEYHSIVVDGPIFKRPLPVRFLNTICSKGNATCDVTVRI